MSYPSRIFFAILSLTLTFTQNTLATSKDSNMPGLIDPSDNVARPRHGLRLPPLTRVNTTPALKEPTPWANITECSSPSVASTDGHAKTPKNLEAWAELSTKESKTLDGKDPWGSLATYESVTLSPTSTVAKTPVAQAAPEAQNEV